MSRVKKPEEGQEVEVYCAWTDTWLKGTVDLLMSEQFAWIAEDGRRFITRYDGGWR